MRKTALVFVLALVAACQFERPIFDMTFEPNGGDGFVDEADGATIGNDVEFFDFDFETSEIGGEELKREETSNPCPAGEYPDPQLLKCLRYPCCDISGSWMMQALSDGDPMANYNYAVNIEQIDAYVELFIVSASPNSIALPDVRGTLAADVMHLDGGDQGEIGFMLMDAKKVEAQLFEAKKIVGSYKLIVNGRPTKGGQWTLIRN